MFKLTEGNILEKDKAKDVLVKDLYEGLVEIKDNIQLDKSLFGYSNRSYLLTKY